MGQHHSHDQPSDELRAGTSRRDFLGSSAAAGASLPLSGLAWAAAPELSGAMGKAAGAWLASLDARQRARALLAWADPMRNGWHYVPRSRPGLALRDS